MEEATDKSTPERSDGQGSVGRQTPEKNPADPPMINEDLTNNISRLGKLILQGKGKLRTSYYVQHFIVWVFLSLVLGAVFYGAAAGKDSYINTLYMAVSAITATSLSSIDLSKPDLGPRIATLVFVTISGAVFESAIPIGLRLWRARGTQSRNPKVARGRAAILHLLVVIVCYYIVVQLTGFIAFGIYLEFSEDGSQIMHSSGNNAWWFSLFHVCTSFENAGFGFLPIATSSSTNSHSHCYSLGLWL